MRKIIAGVLVGLGSFLLVTALLAAFWAGDAVKKTPLDTDTVTKLGGGAEKLNPATSEIESLDVKATSVTKADTELSDDEVVVFVSTVCVVIDEGDVPSCVDADDERLISASSDVFATDRHTAQSVTDSQYVPPSADEKQGLINKWPFDAEQRDYEYWDDLLGQAVPAVYSGTEEINGLETYKYVVTVSETPATIASSIEGIYSSEKEIWIDPVTGSIVNQTQHDVRTLESGDPVLDLSLAFTDEQVEKNVSEAKDNVSQLKLVGTTVPLFAGIFGVVFLGLGIGMFVLGRRRQA